MKLTIGLLFQVVVVARITSLVIDKISVKGATVSC